MPKQIVNISDTIKQFQEKFNTLSTDLGWRGRLATDEDSDFVGSINELEAAARGSNSDYAMKTTAQNFRDAINEHDSDIGNREQLNTDWFVSHDTYSSALPAGIDSNGQASLTAAINEVDFRLDSINDNQINSPHLFITDSSQTNIIKGSLNLHGNMDIDGTLTVDGVVNFKAGTNGAVTLGDANTDNVVFNADVNSHIIPNTDDTYNLGSTSQEWQHLYLDGTAFVDDIEADSATLGTAKVTDLTNNRVVIVGDSGELEDDANLTYDGTDLSTNSLKVTDLTDNRVVIVGTGGAIEDDANFTFNGTQLNIGTGNFTVQHSTGNVYTAGELTVGDSAEFRDNVVVDGNTNLVGELRVGDSAEFNDNVVIDGNLNVATEASLASATVRDLTDNRVVIAGTGGAIEDDANLTFDGTTFKVGGSNFTVTQDSGNTTIAGTLSVTGNTELSDELIVGDSAEFRSNIVVDGNASINNINARGTLDVSGNTTLGDELVVVDSAEFRSNIVVDGDANIDNITARGDVDVLSNLHVTDSSSFGGNLSIDSDLVIGGTVRSNDTAFKISADSATTDNVNLSDTIRISGGEGIDAKIIADKHIRVSGEIASTSNAGVASFASADFDVTAAGHVSINSIGNSQIDNSYWTIADSNGDTYTIDLGDELQLIGKGGNVRVTKGNDDQIKFKLDSDVRVDGDLVVHRDATVERDLTVTRNLVVAGATRITAHTFKMGEGVESDTNPTINGTISIDRGSQDSAVLVWNESLDRWTAGVSTDARKLAREDDSANFQNVTIDSDLTVGRYLHVIDSAKFDNDVSIAGNLTVNGTTVTLNTATLDVEDRIITLNKNQTVAPTLDAGLVVERGTKTDAKLQWDESADYWIAAYNDDATTAQIVTAANMGTEIEWDATNKAVKHSNVTRTNSTATANVGTGVNDDTFTAVTGITTNARGHVTAVTTTTYQHKQLAIYDVNGTKVFP